MGCAREARSQACGNLEEHWLENNWRYWLTDLNLSRRCFPIFYILFTNLFKNGVKIHKYWLTLIMIIKLVNVEWALSCSFSQIVPHENQHVCVFFGPYYHFSFVFWIKTNTQGNVATTCPYESPWTPTFDDLVRFWIMSVKNNPRYNVSLVDNWRHW